MTSESDDLSELRIPPTPASVSIARLFAAAVGRVAECDSDMIEDVRLAVAEAVTRAMLAQAAVGNNEPIVVQAALGPTDVQFGVDSASAVGPGGTDGIDDDLGLAVIQSLFPDVEVLPGAISLRFSAPRAGAPHSG